jgi:phosphotransferase system enzyme I (PtsI)
VYCNIGSPEDVDAVLSNDGGGIGLFRSEFLYLNSSTYPTEDEQFEAYKAVLSGMSGKEVIIRTCDIGADKQIDYFELPKEENPALGMRALRISLTRPGFFRTQLRALYRASAYGKLGIMFPMVTSVWEVRETKKLIEDVKRELRKEGLPYSDHVEIGIMIETPAAAILSDRLAKEVDFFSCGTNDLTQYTLACDRQNNDLGRFYDPHHPAVVRLLKMVVDNAHRNGIWVGICGELGADLEMTETFLAIGIDELSVSPRAVLPLRQKIRSINTAETTPAILADINSDATQKF